jgi:hypothetical protein
MYVLCMYFAERPEKSYVVCRMSYVTTTLTRLAAVANKLPDVLGNKSFDIDAATLTEPEDPEDFEATWTVEADVEGRTGTTTSRVRFSMRRKRVGTYKGCLMTYMIETL